MTKAMPFLQKVILLSYDPRLFGGDFLSSAADPACWTFQALVEPIDRGGDKNVLPST